MTEFHFANPAYLFLLLALPVLQFLVSRFQLNARERLLRFMAEENLQKLLKEKGKGGGNRKRWLFWIGLALVIVALARPQANPRVEEMEGASLDIYILLDVSRSMDAEDVPPSRLAKAKRSIQSLTQLLGGDRIGVIAFAGTAVMISPLTADYDVIKTFMQNVDTSLIQNQGTDITGALSVAEAAMKRGAEKTGSTGPRSNVFVVMSDGEDHTPHDLSVVDQIRDQGGIIFTIAFGTEAGSSIPVRNERGELSGHKRDRAGNQVKTVVQTKALEEIASRGGGQFYFSTMDEGEIRDILQRVQNMDRNGAAVLKAKVYEEFFFPVLAIATLLLAFSFFSIRTAFTGLKIGTIRRAFSLLLLFLPLGASATPLSFLWNKERRAFQGSQDLLQEGKNDEAVDRLKALLAENPDSPELNFDIGTYLLDAKKNDEGRAQLQRLVDRENPLREHALFNIAGSYAQEQKKDEARAAYAEAIHSLQVKNRTKEQDELLRMARENLSRLETNPPPPQNQSGGGGKSDEQKPDQDKKDQKPGEDGKSGESPDKKDEDKKGDPKKDDSGKEGEKPKDEKEKGKDGEEKKDEEAGNKGDEKKDDQDGSGEQPEEGPTPKGMRPGKKPFQEKGNVPEEDAKRILEALKQRETSLQKKFMKQQKGEGKSSENDSDKDW